MVGGVRQRIWAAVLAGHALVGACGGQSEQRAANGENPMSGSGGTAGTGEQPGGGGPAGGATGGARPGGGGGTLGGSPIDAGATCPATAPATAFPTCPGGLPAEGCTYELECQSGPRSFDYRCGERGSWSVDPGTCDFPSDFCWGGDAQVRCNGESWQLMGWGGDPPQDCALERPAPGAECFWSQLSPPSTCGYRCPDGTGWTVASCAFAATTSVWLLDGACPGDCSAHERALLDYVTTHRGCETDADCRYLESSCAFTRSHCSGAFAVGPSVDPAEFAHLDDALSACASEPDSGWPCGGCDAEPEAVRCVNETCTLDEGT